MTFVADLASESNVFTSATKRGVGTKRGIRDIYGRKNKICQTVPIRVTSRCRKKNLDYPTMEKVNETRKRVL